MQPASCAPHTDSELLLPMKKPRLRFPLRDEPDADEWNPLVDWICALILAIWINGIGHFLMMAYHR